MIKQSSLAVWVVGAVASVSLLMTAGVAYAVTPTFSQSNVTVGVGQSVTVASQNGTSLYMGLNSNPIIASIAANGTQITVTGQSVGSTSVTVCTVGTAGDCTNLSITVQGTAVTGISFNPNNLSLLAGASQSVTVTGGNGTYAISSNSNTGIASASLSGNALTIAGIAAGTANIAVCDTANACGTLAATVNANSSTNASSSSGLTFNQNNISLVTGGNQVVTVSGGNGIYHIASNSNGNAISASIANNAITIYATAAGSGTVTVCDAANVCGALSVTGTLSTANQALTFNPANATLAVGQNLNVALSGSASTYVILANTNTNVAQASVSNATLALTGLSAGTDTVSVCATAGGCSSLSITVTGSAAVATTTPATPAPAVVTTTAVTPAVPTGIVVNSTLLVEIQALQNAVTQMATQLQSMQTQLNQLVAQVSAGSGSSVSANINSTNNASSDSGTSQNFTEQLKVGSESAEVRALQTRLATLGFYSGAITGYYGSQTSRAVSKYQSAHGIESTGSVGPSTRTSLNGGN